MIDEKVLIKRLEEYKYSHLIEHDSERSEHCEENDSDYCQGTDCFLCVWNKATEIVKDLASEHNNDFCEWKEDGVFYNIDCKGKEYICTAISEFEFCPYCGKKIKVMPVPYKKGE